VTEWREVTLEQLAAPSPHALATGPFGSAISSKHFLTEGVPVIRGSNLSLDVGARLKDDGLVFLSPEKAATFRRSIARRRDLVFTCWGTVGQIGLVDDRATFDEYIVSNKQMKLTPDPQEVESHYLYYLLSSPAMVANVQGQSIGAAVPGLNLGQLRQLRVRLPGVATQRRIAGVLCVLDDLIENNRRRIELLEQMAQVIYREWFVRFRYPGHEDATFVDSPLGPIPEGWEVTPLRDVATVVRGRSYRKNELVETGGVPFVNLKCMMRGGGFRRDGLKRYTGKHNSDQRVDAGDIVLAVTDLTQGREILARATLVPRLDEDFGVISLDVIRLIPKEPQDRLAVLFTLRCTDFSDRVKEYANGSTVLHLSPTHVADGEIVWPHEGLRRSYAHIADPILREVDDLKDTADRLAGIRDLLLPKLVTGEIDVSDLDLDAVVGSVA
jgi:type I restriction enzyme S subunit